MNLTPTPHIEAKKGDFASTVLMPGDSGRADFMANRFLKDAVKVNGVRSANAYTGTYNGARVSVMASGMGCPSIGIYSKELFDFYGVESIIRVGTIGAISDELHVGDIVLAAGACYNGDFVKQYRLPGTFSAIADFELLKKAADQCEKRGIRYAVGNVLSSDYFYDDAASNMIWGKMNVLGLEMEAAALYQTAARHHKKALAICTVSDSFVYPSENASAKERTEKFIEMMEVAFEIAR